MSKKLWEYDNQALFEVDNFHHCPDQYNSWREFINSDALSCNCISGNPLLYWYWDCDNDELSCSSDEKWGPIEGTPENFKRIILIYRSWFSGMAKIIILVSPDDEYEIRKFICANQSNQSVSID
jgi:hypothetical protein